MKEKSSLAQDFQAKLSQSKTRLLSSEQTVATLKKELLQKNRLVVDFRDDLAAAEAEIRRLKLQADRGGSDAGEVASLQKQISVLALEHASTLAEKEKELSRFKEKLKTWMRQMKYKNQRDADCLPMSGKLGERMVLPSTPQQEPQLSSVVTTGPSSGCFNGELDAAVSQPLAEVFTEPIIEPIPQPDGRAQDAAGAGVLERPMFGKSGAVHVVTPDLSSQHASRPPSSRLKFRFPFDLSKGCLS